MKAKKLEREQTIKGLVVAASWDEGSNIIQVAIRTDDEDEYLVENKGVGAELLECDNEEVKATGIIKEDKEGNNIITVSRYEVINPEPLQEDNRDDYWEKEV